MDKKIHITYRNSHDCVLWVTNVQRVVDNEYYSRGSQWKAVGLRMLLL